MQKKGAVKILQTPIGLLFLTALVLLVNVPVISFEMFYPEQASIYVANQRIVHFYDLLNIYFNPQIFDAVIPFFRPSGHFLMYQLLAPILGWHHLQAFIIVNLFFLALTGFYIIKLYPLLFPRCYIGGLIAFSYFLMHPALSLSRFIVLHFEFAYMFFSMAGLYYFVSFCQDNIDSVNQKKKLTFSHQGKLFLSLLFFIIAVTFKEPALMMGPIYFLYFCMTFYSQGALKQKTAIQILLLLVTITAFLMFYLLLAWPQFHNPIHNDHHFNKIIGTINAFFLKFIFALPFKGVPFGVVNTPTMSWRPIIFPLITRFIIWGLFILAFMMVFFITARKIKLPVEYRRSLVFLCVGGLAFLILPVGWAMALPWHLSLMLIFLSLALGFIVEYFLQQFVSLAWAHGLGMVLFLLIAFSTIVVNQVNIERYQDHDDTRLTLLLNKNAVRFPPPIKDQLNNNSLLVIADSLNIGDYALGDTADPLHYLHAFDRHFMSSQQTVFLKAEPTYNGTLFKFAYLMPDLKEEIYPFQVDLMQILPDIMIYDWSTEGNNIFCFEYNEQGQWLDRTAIFKKNLAAEQTKRHLITRDYHHLPATSLGGTLVARNKLDSPNVKICQFLCDRDPGCQGFTFLSHLDPNQLVMQCLFYSKIDPLKQKFCPSCQAFFKD